MGKPNIDISVEELRQQQETKNDMYILVLICVICVYVQIALFVEQNFFCSAVAAFHHIYLSFLRRRPRCLILYLPHVQPIDCGFFLFAPQHIISHTVFYYWPLFISVSMLKAINFFRFHVFSIPGPIDHFAPKN